MGIPGAVLTWVNEQISRRPGLGLDKATQEPSKITPKRSDLVIWWNRAANNAFFTVELKTPEVPINNPTLLNDACEKAIRWGAPCFAIWNMQAAELYKTPKSGTATPADRVYPFPLNPLIGSVDDWLDWRLVAAVLTSSLFALSAESYGSASMGAGVLELATTMANGIRVVDIRGLKDSGAIKEVTALAEKVWDKTKPVDWEAAEKPPTELQDLDRWFLSCLETKVTLGRIYSDLAATLKSRVAIRRYLHHAIVV